ncbi:MAG: hypothetical protein V3R48_00465 [Thermoplasmata archaeon]
MEAISRLRSREFTEGHRADDVVGRIADSTPSVHKRQNIEAFHPLSLAA